MADGTQTHYRTCHLCEAMCGVVITHEPGGRILSIKGDKDDPFSRGHVCPKAVALQDLQDDPDRLRRPIKRVGTEWIEISWDEAFDTVERELMRARREHGNDAVGLYIGNPTAHNTGAMLMLLPFLAAMRTRNRYSATSVDQLPTMLANLQMFGNAALFPVPDLDRTDFLLMIGANPVASGGSVAAAGNFPARMKAIRARGGHIVLIDPRRNESAELADTHHFIRPGTDVFLLAAMIHVLFEDRLVQLDRLEAFTDGVEAIRSAVAPFPPEAVAQATGIDAAQIRKLARAFAHAERAVCYGRIGTCTQEFGGLTTWLIYALNVLTGNLDREGGAMFPHPAIDVIGMAAGHPLARGSFDTFRSRQSQLPEFLGELPVAALAEEMRTPGQGQIKAFVTFSGNPVLSTPNGPALEQALDSLDFMVSIDCYLNETTKHAHLILPPTGPLEREHYDVALNGVAVRNVAKYAPAMLEAPPDARHDWQIMLELIVRLSAKSAPGRRIGRAVQKRLERAGVEGMLDWLLKNGPYGTSRLARGNAWLREFFLTGRIHQVASKGLGALLGQRIGIAPMLQAQAAFSGRNRGLDIATLKGHPHGIDLGALEPALPAKLCTKKQRIQLAPDIFLADLPRAQERLRSKRDKNQLVLIGRRHVRSNNSWMHNSHRLVKGKNRCTIFLNPEDARRLKLTEGGQARVTSAVGSIELPVEITADIMPGVVSVPHGFGHHREGIRLGVAQGQAAGASLNDITNAEFVDRLTGVTALNGLPVQVTRLATTTRPERSAMGPLAAKGRASRPQLGWRFDQLDAGPTLEQKG
ncbi:MAG: molybdopterin-dependent oxidoreductase [Sinimarinibacterium sp.]|jgi:anaerobic selenocysteine-containing dehydrogenase